MVEPTGSEKASSIVFQLHLEGSETSQMSQRNSMATANDSRNGEGEVLTEIQFSRLEALDPQKRELLEARFHTPRNDASASRKSPLNLMPSFTSQFHADSSSTLPYPLKAPLAPELESDGSDGVDSAGIFVHESTQTILTTESLREMETFLSTGVASSQQKESKIEELKGLVEDYKKQVEVQQSTLEKKAGRERCMKNRLRLGQFVPVRQGVSFVETWVEGHAFKDLAGQQERINQQREELEKQKKTLAKKKPPSNTASTKEKKLPRTSSGESDQFARPGSPEETDVQTELEKLDRERMLHIRELKRTQNEDSSKFKDHPTLNKRYLLLNLLGKGGFSEVYKGYDLLEHRYVACKIHQLSNDWKEDRKANYIKHALREYNIHKTLDHPFAVKFYFGLSLHIFQHGSSLFCTVLEYCDGNDLDFLLKQHKTVPEREV
ncbi:unnamed protein product, partial [Porites lobata]